MTEFLRRQQIEIERWTQAAGQRFQAEIEKAIVQGLTAAFRNLAERLPELLAQVPPPQAMPFEEPPNILRIPIAEAEPIASTREQPAAPEATVAESPERARQYLRRGIEAERAGDTERALVHFTCAVGCDAQSAPTHLVRGRLLRRLGRNEEALADADDAVRLDPCLAPAYYLRATVLMRRGDNAQAIDDLTRFLELQPDHALAYHARGLAHTNEGNYERAIGDFGRALRLRPKLLPARYQRALAYRLKGEYAFAVAEWTKILERQPDFARGYYERALARMALEEYECALEDFDKAAELAPQDEEIRARRERARQARASTPPKPPSPTIEETRSDTSHPVESTLTDPTFLPLTCPGCGAAARISWKHLDRLFRCRKCTRVYRVNREGHLTQFDPNPPPSRRSRWLKRAAVSVAVSFIVFIAIFIISKMRHKPALAELPSDLHARGELWGKAWLNDDRLLLRRLTAPTHDRQLHPWLLRHPPPTAKDPAASPPQIHLQVRETNANERVVIVSIRADALQSPQAFSLDWVKRGDTWFFVPTLKR